MDDFLLQAVTDAEEAALLPPPPRIAATGSAAEGAAAAGASAGSKGQQAAVAEDEEEDGLDIPNAETIRWAAKLSKFVWLVLLLNAMPVLVSGCVG